VSAPCVRIELTYADGSKKIAIGQWARTLHEWLDRWCPTVAFHPAVIDIGRDTLPDSNPALRGDQESA
jgi:hypothetical protein